jgi:ribonucleotide monophosphatase NagD (HAD superfamily)
MCAAALPVRYPHRTDRRLARLGKPYAAMCTAALRRSGTRNMVMIGDPLETDIRGARAFGHEAVWVSTGATAADGLPCPPISGRQIACMRLARVQ